MRWQVMFHDYPGEIYVARKDSPMILGTGNGASYIASDVPAILKYTRNVYYIGNLEMARVRKDGITFFNLDGEEIQKEPKTIEWDAEAAEKAGYEHFMMKEIDEPQPRAVEDTLNSVLKDGAFDLSAIGLTDRGDPGCQPDLHRGLRLRLSCRYGSTESDRRSGAHPGARRAPVPHQLIRTDWLSSSVSPERPQTVWRH